MEMHEVFGRYDRAVATKPPKTSSRSYTNVCTASS